MRSLLSVTLAGLTLLALPAGAAAPDWLKKGARLTYAVSAGGQQYDFIVTPKRFGCKSRSS